MKNTLVIALLLATLGTATAQTLSPQVTPTAGGYLSSGGFSLSYTIGETHTATLTAGASLLTQGQQQPEINLLASSLSGELCAGGMVTVSFVAAGYVAPDNTFTLQLSDAAGNFGSPFSLGTQAGTAGGSITGTIPPNTVVGPGYRVRVVSSQPNFVGSAQSVPSCTCAAPSLVCPANVQVSAAPNQCSNTANWAVSSPSGNCEPTAVGTASPNATVFPVGTTTVTYTATNARDVQSGSCTFTVTVSDGQNPTIICPGNISKTTDPNLCSAVATYASPTFSDNCAGVVLTRTGGLASGSQFPTGMTNVAWKATDAAGNSSVCNFTVTVTDAQAPAIACPANIVRSADAGLCTAVTTYASPTGSDNCGAPTLTRTSGLASGSAFPKGTSTVTWEARDAATPANTKTCSFTVTVNDTQLPSINCPTSQTKSTDAGLCTAVTNYTTPTMADNCSGGSTSLVSGLASGQPFPKGITTVQWKATDAAGLTKTCTFRVTVNDTETPTISCPASQSLSTDPNLCSAVATYSTPTGADNCTPPPTVVKTSGLVSGSAFPKGANTVVWKATDGAGLTKTCSFTVTVTDVQLPTIACPQNISVTGSGSPCVATVNYASPTAADNCAVQSVFLLSGLGSGASFPAGTTNMVWRAIDNSGLSATCSFTVTVSCATSPSSATVTAGKGSKLEGDTQAEKGKMDFHLTPNPVTTEAQVWAEKELGTDGELRVLDAQGRLMWRQPVATGERQWLLDLDGRWQSGLYFVTLRTKRESVTKRLVVQRM